MALCMDHVEQLGQGVGEINVNKLGHNMSVINTQSCPSWTYLQGRNRHRDLFAEDQLQENLVE